MSGVTPTGSGLFKFLKPGMRPQAIDVQTAAMWGVAAGTTALWIVQVSGCCIGCHCQIGAALEVTVNDPFSWLQKTFFEKPVSEGN